MKIGVFEALSKGVEPENLPDALQPTFWEIRRIAALAQERLDEANARADDALKQAERAQAAHQRTYERTDERIRSGLAGIRAASFADEGFDPHGFFVYFLWGDDPDCPLYVGKSTNILARLGSHLGDISKRSRIERVTFLRCETATQMDQTESRMIRHHQPPLNIMGIRDRV